MSRFAFALLVRLSPQLSPCRLNPTARPTSCGGCATLPVRLWLLGATAAAGQAQSTRCEDVCCCSREKEEERQGEQSWPWGCLRLTLKQRNSPFCSQALSSLTLQRALSLPIYHHKCFYLGLFVCTVKPCYIYTKKKDKLWFYPMLDHITPCYNIHSINKDKGRLWRNPIIQHMW